MPKKSQKLPINNIIYQWENWEILLREDKKLETIWASLDQISTLFWKNKSTISRHVRNIFDSDELVLEQAVAKYATVQKEWHNLVTRNIEYYNLDMILSIGYRVNSKQATEFRKWANSILKSYITDWIAVNASLLQKNTRNFKQALSYLQSLEPKAMWKLINKVGLFVLCGFYKKLTILNGVKLVQKL